MRRKFVAPPKVDERKEKKEEENVYASAEPTVKSISPVIWFVLFTYLSGWILMFFCIVNEDNKYKDEADF